MPRCLATPTSVTGAATVRGASKAAGVILMAIPTNNRAASMPLLS
jgi:hypothetical protein